MSDSSSTWHVYRLPVTVIEHNGMWWITDAIGRTVASPYMRDSMLQLAALINSTASDPRVIAARKALEEIAAMTDCLGPGCPYCDEDYVYDHPPSEAAKIASQALAGLGGEA